jgi:hypothetical protein
MSAEIEQSLAERYHLDFTGKSHAEKSEMIKKKLLEHEKKLQKI